GLICAEPPEEGFAPYRFAHTASYNHAISSLALSEAYGMADRALAGRIKEAIEKAKAFSLGEQIKPKPLPEDVGGWRYLRQQNLYAERIFYSDLSVTSWQLLSLRSARNAGFDVPPERIESALTYIKRCFHDG